MTKPFIREHHVKIVGNLRARCRLDTNGRPVFRVRFDSVAALETIADSRADELTRFVLKTARAFAARLRQGQPQ